MGILDDLAMGFGFKEKDRDYYDRTAATIAKNQGSDASDSYKKYVGMTGGSVSKTNPLGIMSGSSYANAPNYFQKIGPSLSDFRPVPTTGANSDPYDSSGNLRPDYKPGSAAQRYRDVGRPQPGTLPHTLTRFPGILGILANVLGGYKPIAPQTELPSTYKPQSVKPAPASPARSLRPQLRPSQAAGIPLGMETQYSASPAPLLAAPDVQLEAFTGNPSAPIDQLEAFTGNPSDPMFRPGGEFDAFMEQTGSLPAFDPYRNDRNKMIEIFREYLKTQGSGS